MCVRAGWGEGEGMLWMGNERGVGLKEIRIAETRQEGVQGLKYRGNFDASIQ